MTTEHEPIIRRSWSNDTWTAHCLCGKWHPHSSYMGAGFFTREGAEGAHRLHVERETTP